MLYLKICQRPSKTTDQNAQRVAVFTIAKNRKQPKCLSTNECINKMQYVCTHTHTQIFFSCKNE